MEWQPGQMSSDIDDRRGDSYGGGGGGGFNIGGGGIGIVGFIILVVLSLVTGHNFLGGLFGGGSGQTQSGPVQPGAGSGMYGPAGQNGETSGTAPDESHNQRDDAHLISFVLDNVQNFWTQEFQKEGWGTYKHARLVLFTGSTYSGCGTAQAATGPFYCPEDKKVYIDLSFWNELKRFGGSTADFAQAYVLAHELGHHVQDLLGTEQKVEQAEQDGGNKSQLSVATELQADCYGGVWAHYAQQKGVVDPGDIDAALSAVAAVGDDHLEKMAGRAVTPDSFTHGSSAQREQWFKTGFGSGDPNQCTTYNGRTQPQ